MADELLRAKVDAIGSYAATYGSIPESVAKELLRLLDDALAENTRLRLVAEPVEPFAHLPFEAALEKFVSAHGMYVQSQRLDIDGDTLRTVEIIQRERHRSKERPW